MEQFGLKIFKRIYKWFLELVDVNTENLMELIKEEESMKAIKRLKLERTWGKDNITLKYNSGEKAEKELREIIRLYKPKQFWRIGMQEW